MSCTPWWVTLLIAVVGIIISPLLAVNRERRKAAEETSHKLRDEIFLQMSEILQDARLHYSDKACIGDGSEKSSAAIVSGIRSVGRLLNGAKFEKPYDLKVATRQLTAFNLCVTGDPDFQNPNRSARIITDPIFSEFDRLEEAVSIAVRKPMACHKFGWWPLW